MNVSDIHKLTDKEIVQSMARMMGSPMEKAFKAELEIRLTSAVSDLSTNIYTLRLSLDSIAKTNKRLKLFLIIISFCMILLVGLVGYLLFVSS